MAVARPAGVAALVRLRLSGVAFLVVIALLVALTVALYQKAFTPVVKVTLKTDRIGNPNEQRAYSGPLTIFLCVTLYPLCLCVGCRLLFFLAWSCCDRPSRARPGTCALGRQGDTG